MLETNTPRFRIALTIAAIWVLVFSYKGYGAYNSAAYSAAPYDTLNAEECSGQKLDADSGSEFRWRPPTFKEMQDCRAVLEKTQRRWANFEQQRVAIASLKWALIPPAILLLVAASWIRLAKGGAMLRRGLLQTAKGYVNWVRGGRNPDQ